MNAERPFRRGSQLITGRLLAHGRAHYEFRADQDLSYYLKVQTSRGERILWGKGLERALGDAHTHPKVGDLIGARRVGRQTFTHAGREGENPQTRHRTQWEVEKAAYFAERARRARTVRDAQTDARAAVRQNPELKSTFLSLRSAEQLAAQRIANPKDRERFLELVREAIAGSIHRGEPLPEVRLRERRGAPERKRPPRPRERDEPTR
jgi:hypothetical protein